MKRTEVIVKSGRLGWVKLPGYEAEIDGVPVVVHRDYSIGYEGSRVTLRKPWTVSEPTTGLSLGHFNYPTRAEALAEARRRVAERGVNLAGVVARSKKRPADAEYVEVEA